MTNSTIQHELNTMTIGFTKVVNNHVVTRWNVDVFEIDTYGKAINQRLVNVEKAVELVAL